MLGWFEWNRSEDKKKRKEVGPKNKKVDFFFSNLFTTINSFTVIFEFKYLAVLIHRKLKNDVFKTNDG